MIDPAIKDKIFAVANIVEVVSDFVTLKKRGVNYIACCPFHNEKTPSFVVSPTKGVFKCFGCGKAGNAVTFLMEHEHLSFVDAMKYLGRKYNIEVQDRELTPEQQQAHDQRQSMLAVNTFAAEYFVDTLNNTPQGQSIGLSYLRERGISDSAIKKFGLGYCPAGKDTFSQAALKAGYKLEYLTATGLTIQREDGSLYDRFSDRVIFPIHSVSGTVIGFGGRIMSTEKKTAKYLNSPESDIYHKSETLYGIFFARNAISRADNCILVEGYTDVISMHSSGIENVVASSGTSLTKEQITLISRFTKNVTVIYDGDAAGIKASLRGIDMILEAGLNVRCVPLPEGEDPDSFARQHTASELEAYIEANTEDFITFKTNILIGDAGSDPLRRANAIKDIVESIAVIPDKITRSVYVKQCAQLLEIEAEILDSEVLRKINQRNYTAQEVREIENLRRIEQKKQKQTQSSEQPASNTESPRIEQFERELIGYLLQHGHEYFHNTLDNDEVERRNVAEYIISELDYDGIRLQNTTFDNILMLYRAHWQSALENARNENPQYDPLETLEKNGWQFPMHVFNNCESVDIAQTVSDIVMQDEKLRPSKLWEEYDMPVCPDRLRLSDLIPRTINIYKSKIVEQMIAQIQSRLDSPELSEEEVVELIDRIKLLNESRVYFCQKYTRIII